ncbi:ABC transporter ATP-binding protein [Salisaeta longa]|uniref:ABC transporter ATP-binding protein n=1 Tax=Salisaeta longa TaxID=503170 RepID=UPI00040AFAC1|nr:ABC transporter ATP-binding protein [Salisaeta longa]
MASSSTTDARTEEQKLDALNGTLLRRMIATLAPYRGWVVLALVITVTASLLGPLRPWLIQQAIDNYIVTGDLDGLGRIIGFLVLALVGEGVFAFGKNYLTQWIGQHAIDDLRTRVFEHIQRQPLSFFDRTPIGKLITRTTSDVQALSDLLSSGVVVILGDSMRVLFIAAFMFYYNVTLALVTLAVLPLMIAVTAWFRKNARAMYRETRKQVSRMNAFIQEHVTGMAIVQLFGREADEMERFRSINDDHRQAQIKTIFYFAVFWPAVQIVSDVALGAVLWFGGLRSMTGTLTLGVLIAFLQYVRQFFQPIRNLSNQYDTLQRALSGAERIYGLVDEDERLAERDDPVTLDAVAGRIEFRNVWFAYEDDAEGAPDWILKDVSFTVEPGETLALVGATGAGKSTVMNVLLRFYDVQRGDIFLDGVNIRDLRLDDLRQHLGLVLQDVFLFSGSVERNLTLGDDTIDPDTMKRAADLVQASDFIERLPNGYQQDVKERGSSLSHGQRQLLAFVRALLYDPAVMVLDEATSSVDTETEQLIQNALERLTENRTTLAIAHRLSTIRDADQILVMHKGEIRERGTHQELLAHEGLYRKLYDLQYRDQERAAAA